MDIAQKDGSLAMVLLQLGLQGHELYEKIVTLSKDFASRAAKHDEDASFPLENNEKLHRAGLLGLPVPKEYGGLGADPLTHSLCLLEMAKGCPSTALTFTMYSTDLTFIAALGIEEQKQRYFREVAEKGSCLAAVTSEPGSSWRDKFEMKTIFRPVDGRRPGVSH